MKTNHLFASAAVAAVLVMTAPAQAQILGGAARGSAFAGSFGSVSGMGSTNGRMSAGSDTSLRGSTHAPRTAAVEPREASKISAHASDATSETVRAGRESSEAVAQAAIVSSARETHKTSSLAAGALAESASTAPFVGENGDAVASESSNAQPASRPGKSAESGAHTPARSGGPATQSAEPPRKITPEADGSASASGEASANVSSAQ